MGTTGQGSASCLGKHRQESASGCDSDLLVEIFDLLVERRLVASAIHKLDVAFMGQESTAIGEYLLRDGLITALSSTANSS